MKQNNNNNNYYYYQKNSKNAFIARSCQPLNWYLILNDR